MLGLEMRPWNVFSMTSETLVQDLNFEGKGEGSCRSINNLHTWTIWPVLPRVLSKLLCKKESPPPGPYILATNCRLKIPFSRFAPWLGLPVSCFSPCSLGETCSKRSISTRNGSKKRGEKKKRGKRETEGKGSFSLDMKCQQRKFFHVVVNSREVVKSLSTRTTNERSHWGSLFSVILFSNPDSVLNRIHAGCSVFYGWCVSERGSGVVDAKWENWIMSSL